MDVPKVNIYLGGCYRHGIGTEQNIEQAEFWHKKFLTFSIRRMHKLILSKVFLVKKNDHKYQNAINYATLNV